MTRMSAIDGMLYVDLLSFKVNIDLAEGLILVPLVAYMQAMFAFIRNWNL